MNRMLKTEAGGEAAPLFHDGERRVQERMGTRGIEAWARTAIRSRMPDQHRAFYAAQPFLIVSARDGKGRPWATVLEGKEGFVSSSKDTVLEIHGKPVSGDALEGAFQPGADAGILGIELATRRRNRANGRVLETSGEGFALGVDLAFGNCPQYIRARAFRRVRQAPAVAVSRGSALTASQKTWIATADTFFIASGYRGTGEHPGFGMDVSHRGGARGVVEVLGDRRIRFPDFAGNKLYNTLGNILADPRAGFLFLDFSTGSLLQLTGRAEIERDPDELRKYPDAQQFVSLEIEEIVELTSALRLRWQEEAASARSLRLIEKKRENADVTSFVFEARDGGPLPEFKAGQHLPVELKLPGAGKKLLRTYSLSGPPADPRYRISVKRLPDGAASRLLHDALEPGAIVECQGPAGDFTLPEGEDPLVLVSAGIGITPLLAMLHQLAGEGGSRPVWFVHGVRDGEHHPFREEVRRLVEGRAAIQALTWYSGPLASDVHGRDYDRPGRITVDALVALTDPARAHYLLCGPAGFLADMTSGLERRGVPESRIRSESF